MKYIALKIKSNYSLLNSLIDIDELVSYANENNIKTLGLCDDNLYGVMDFYESCVNNDIKPIIGLEISIENNNLLLYAKNYNGYKNLCYIESNDKTFELIKSHSDDLICIVPYNSIEIYDNICKNFNDIYVCYNNLTEREKIEGKKCIYLNDIRCINKEDTKYIKYAYMIKDGNKISSSDQYNFDNNYFNMDVSINENDLINYKVIESMCNLVIKKDNNLLPKYSNDENFDENKYLENLCKKGLMKRFNNKVKVKYVKRLEYELGIINKMGFSNYFLVVWDFIKYAKKNNIMVGPGRGSAAGALVSYCLGISDIDPIEYDLYFERFLNPERVTMPDIDIDFDSVKREDVINYVKEKYGEKNVSNIITFGTLKSKQVLRDVARIFDYEIDSFIKLFDSNKSLLENKKDEKILSKLKQDTLLSRIFDIATHLEGLKRHTSINASGIIISNKELDNYIPIYNQNGVFVTGYVVNHLEKLGFLKMDFLAVDNLTLLSKLKEELNLDLNNIPLDDKKTFDIYNTANTDGIFQFESDGMKNVLSKFNVTSFNDLVALIALFRPGPMDNIDLYIKRKEGREKIEYIHDDLKDILQSTFGIIIYQEQIMMIAQKIAGFTLGEADILRRAMSKKKKDIMKQEKIKFVFGAVNNGYNKEIAEKIYDLIYKFANYGFNKSHSVCYALVSYKLAYIKANYRSCFMSHLLSMATLSDNKIKDYILECKRNNVEILKPDINKSYNYFKQENNSIRYSLSSIKKVGNLLSNKIIEERLENGIFIDFFDFVSRCNSFIDKNNLELLIHSGCFDLFGYNHKTLINNIDSAYNYADLVKDLDKSLVEKPEMNVFNEFEKEELIDQELKIFGFYLTNHPLQNKRKNDITTNDIKKYFNKEIEIYLIIDSKREIITKNGDRMAFFSGSDEFGKIDLVMFPKIYENNYTIKKGDIALVKSNVERRFNSYQLVINNIEKLN